MEAIIKTKNQEDRRDDYIGPLRTKATWKPRVNDDALSFFRCKHCGTVYAMIDNTNTITCPGKGRDRIMMFPTAAPANTPECCGEAMELIPFLDAEDVKDRFELDYQIVGGVNENTLRVMWERPDKSLDVRWCYLKTFTGSQMKYVQPDKGGPLVFGFGDEDAFTYCHDNPCRECVFRCKSGFEIYMYVDGLGLVRLTMDRILADMMGKK